MRLIYSCLFYLCSFYVLAIMRAGVGTLLFSIPVMALMALQALWGARLFIVTNLRGLSPCNLMMGEYFGDAIGGFVDLIYAPYYFLVSVGSIGFIAYSHWRYRQQRKAQVQLSVLD